jgi:hypothetical protein
MVIVYTKQNGSPSAKEDSMRSKRTPGRPHAATPVLFSYHISLSFLSLFSSLLIYPNPLTKSKAKAEENPERSDTTGHKNKQQSLFA